MKHNPICKKCKKTPETGGRFAYYRPSLCMDCKNEYQKKRNKKLKERGVIMDKVEVWEESVYRWNCPGCGEANEDECELDEVICDQCGQSFEADLQ